MPYHGYFWAIGIALWRRDSYNINIYWHPWFGPILGTFGCLEVSFADNSSLVWPGVSEVPAPLSHAGWKYCATRLRCNFWHPLFTAMAVRETMQTSTSTTSTTSRGGSTTGFTTTSGLPSNRNICFHNNNWCLCYPQQRLVSLLSRTTNGIFVIHNNKWYLCYTQQQLVSLLSTTTVGSFVIHNNNWYLCYPQQ